MSKVISLRALKKLNFKNKKVILVGGAFDILSVGHIRFLNKCKKFGDILIIGLDNNALDIRGRSPFDLNFCDNLNN